MNILDIITKKKNGETLTHSEIKYAFEGYLNKEIPDYQMSALLMAITINGMMKSSLPISINAFTSSLTQADFAELGEQITTRYLDSSSSFLSSFAKMPVLRSVLSRNTGLRYRLSSNSLWISEGSLYDSNLS